MILKKWSIIVSGGFVLMVAGSDSYAMNFRMRELRFNHDGGTKAEIGTGQFECVTVADTSSNTPTSAPTPVPSVTSSPEPVASNPSSSPSPAVTDTGSPVAVTSADDASSNTPESTSLPSPSPTQSSEAAQYRITFTREPNNSGMISADIYLLTVDGRKVKQVGHAEVTPPSAPNSSVSGSSSVNLKSDPSSPFQFEATIDRSGTEGERNTGTLITGALFSSDTLSGMPLRCH